MPELPEVETVCRGLDNALKNKRIEEILLRRNNLRFPLPIDLQHVLIGKSIMAVKRRAKYILFITDSNYLLLAHLGMSGRFKNVSTLPDHYAAHDHVIIRFSDNTGLIYNDTRRFGMMDILLANQLNTHRLLANLGPEPLDDTFSATYLESQLSSKKAPIKSVLMDQKIVVGVGNIYASEALFLSHIHPLTPASEVAEKSASLVMSVRNVLQQAIVSGGSSLRDFFDTDGKKGYFQHQFLVYGRKGEKCTNCSEIIENIRISGRASFFCPTCQSV